jgi:hypothetical protein
LPDYILLAFLFFSSILSTSLSWRISREKRVKERKEGNQTNTQHSQRHNGLERNGEEKRLVERC